MLWLALHLPSLPLQVFARGAAEPFPVAVVERRAGRERVSLCNALAEDGGIVRGMPVATAQTVLPGLRLRPRNPAAENRALARLAGWCGQYSDFVAMRRDGLVLEVGASLRLFKGLEALLGQIDNGLQALGYQVRTGVAPTPAAACALARRGGGVVRERRGLPALVSQMPLGCLELEEDTREALLRMGVSDGAALLRLPREGLARRFGPALPTYLDRLLARCAEPMTPYRAPDRFAAQLSLLAETDNREALLFPLRRLLRELCGFLRARQRGVTALEVQLFHHRQPASRIGLNLRVPGAEEEHLLGLLRDRLERVELVHPVLEVGLSALRLQALAPATADLFQAAGRSAESLHHLPERLQARLGEQGIEGLRLHPDHRPEDAWRQARPGTPAPPVTPPGAPRPVWLLPRPLPLQSEAGAPRYRGALTLLQGPERIESGWWDAREARRDYFVAVDPGGGRLWVYREPGGSWYLHGVFA